MDEELRKKAEEKKRKYEEEIAQAAKKNQEKMASEELNDRLDDEEVNKLLQQVEAEIADFKEVMIPLRRPMNDEDHFDTNQTGKSAVSYHIVATADKQVLVSMRGSSISGLDDIRSIITRPDLKVHRVDLLKRFLSRLPKFEQYYVDNMERYKALK